MSASSAARRVAHVAATILLLCVTVTTGTVNYARRLTDIDPAAVCNDGSPALYYINDKQATSSDKWVIRFMGGGWCIDLSTCEQRSKAQPYLMSTAALPDTLRPSEKVSGVPDIFLPFHGILSPDASENPYFADWRQVHLWYCSSDSHLGEAPAGTNTETGPWHFMGKRITQAMVLDLLQDEDLASASEILVTGDSAGGVGVMNNAAFIQEQIRQWHRSKRLSRYKVLVDAGWFLDIPSFSPKGGITFREIAKSLRHNWNATFDRQCEEHFGAEEAWKCFHAQYAWPHLAPRTFFLEYLYDTANLGIDGAKPSNLEAFRREMTASFAAQPSADVSQPSRLPDARLSSSALTGLTAQEKGLNMFSPACLLHESIDSKGFWGLQCNQQRFSSIFIDWYEHGHGVLNVDNQPGYRKDCLDSRVSAFPSMLQHLLTRAPIM